MTEERWIVIPNWRQFQHYKDRAPTWIKNYTRLLSDDDYLSLSMAQRGILHGIWMLYANTNQHLTSTLTRPLLALNQGESSHYTANLEALNRAGFIVFVASKALADSYESASPELYKEEKEQATKLSNGSADLPQDLKGESESAFALVQLLAAVKGTDAVKAQLRSKVEAMALAPYALHSARDELAKAKANGKHIRSDKAYVLAILERYAEPDLDEPEPSLK